MKNFFTLTVLLLMAGCASTSTPKNSDRELSSLKGGDVGNRPGGAPDLPGVVKSRGEIREEVKKAITQVSKKITDSRDIEFHYGLTYYQLEDMMGGTQFRFYMNEIRKAIMQTGNCSQINGLVNGNADLTTLIESITESIYKKNQMSEGFGVSFLCR